MPDIECIISLQDSPARRIPARHQPDAWCAKCAGKFSALDLDLRKAKEELEACKNSQGIFKVRACHLVLHTTIVPT